VSDAPLWRQAFDAVERRVTPPAEQLVRTPGFAVGAALVGRARSVARGAARGLTARAWHQVNLPAGSDVSRLRSQVGALDREVRRLTVALETERRSRSTSRPETEEPHADGAQPADGAGPRPARRRAQRPPGS
jgi:post-segregation antitoxin (ccd killing protein)